MSLALIGMQSILQIELEKRTQECVRILAEKYDFDVTEAFSVINDVIASESKHNNKQITADKKSAREEKKAKNADKPKRATTGYILFGTAERPTIKEECPEIKGKDIIIEIARRWKLLSEKEKSEWKEFAKTPVTSDGEENEE